MTYTRTTTVDPSPTGDSVKQAIQDLDTDLTGAFTAVNDLLGLQSTTASPNKVPKADGSGLLDSAWTPKASAAEVAEASITSKFPTPQSLASLRGHGECYFKISGGNPFLERVGLGRMLVNGKMIQVPTSGVTYSGGSPGASTLRYFYLDDAGALSASATGWSNTTGIPVKSDDSTKVLVGMARTDGSGNWVDTVTQRFCVSWYNRKTKHLFNTIAANRSTGSTSIVEIGLSASERIEFLTWADMPAILSMSGRIANSTANYAARMAVWLDGAVPNKGEFAQSRTTAGDVSHAQISMCPFLLPEGYHYCGFGGGAVSGGGTTTLYAGSNLTGINSVVWG